jgi:hypothetical protein
MLEVETLKSLIETLQMAQKYGFSSTSSPIEPLLEAGTDLMLLLGKLFAQGRAPLRKNPELRFLEKYSDPLGNPKQITLYKRGPAYWDPESAKFLRKIATFLVALKRRQSFSEALKSSELTVVVGSKTSEKKSQKPTLNLKEKRLEFRKKQQAYYRRQSKRKSTLH